MTISIPDGMMDKYYEACDFFIDNDYIGRACTIVYPPKRVPCDNCIVKPVGTTTTNVYRTGGPAPFPFGNCPLCGGNGYSETEITDTIRMRIYWNRSEWMRIGGNIQVEDAEAMAIGYMTDLPKLQRAIEIILIKGTNYAEYRTTLAGKPTPWGFGRNRYFVAVFKAA